MINIDHTLILLDFSINSIFYIISHLRPYFLSFKIYSMFLDKFCFYMTFFLSHTDFVQVAIFVSNIAISLIISFFKCKYSYFYIVNILVLKQLSKENFSILRLGRLSRFIIGLVLICILFVRLEKICNLYHEYVLLPPKPCVKKLNV